MLPRWHIILGAIFSAAIWAVFPDTGWIYIVLIFLSSFLIDFDHYAASVMKTGKWSLIESLKYHEIQGRKELENQKRGIRIKEDFHLFHTVEFHVMVALLGFVWSGFVYVFVGMIFHSFLDFIDMASKDRLYRREYLLTNWIIRKFSKK